ncbi:Sugar transporter ERD6-like 14 [Raphanus sativus]|nr:Sugar transporter ERD6-like 14 [Raphanus sativus]
MAEEVSLLSSPSESSTSLLSEISNASTRAFVFAFTVGSCGAFAFGCIYSLFGSILTVGLILGALICGKLTDLVGRVNTIWITNILFVLGWFAIAFAKAVWLLDLGRLLQGISIGISAYLAKVGRENEVEEILLRLRGANFDVSDEAGEILAYTEHVKQQGDGDHGFLKLFQRKYTSSLTIGVALIALPQLGGLSGYSFYTDSIFISTGVSSDVGFISTSIVQMLAGVLGTALVDVSGRRSLLLVSQAGMFLGCLATAISFFLKENHCWETGTPILALISVTLYFGSYGLGMGSIPSIIASEIYPVDVKGAAGTMCGLASSISAWLVAYSFGFLFQWSATGTFLMFTTVTGIGFVFIAKLVPETKGKSLEEIQSLFSF